MVFAELEQSRRALKQSEAFLRGAFDAAPIGKTVLDSGRRISGPTPRSGGSSAARPPTSMGWTSSNCAVPEDRAALEEMLDLAESNPLDDPATSTGIDRDVRLGAPTAASGSRRRLAHGAGGGHADAPAGAVGGRHRPPPRGAGTGGVADGAGGASQRRGGDRTSREASASRPGVRIRPAGRVPARAGATAGGDVLRRGR